MRTMTRNEEAVADASSKAARNIEKMADQTERSDNNARLFNATVVNLGKELVKTTQKTEHFGSVLEAVVKGLGKGGASGVVDNLKTLMDSAAFQVMILQKVVQLCGKVISDNLRSDADSWKEASVQAQAYADSVSNVEAVLKKMDSQTGSNMMRLGKLIRQEKLSNMEQLEMVQLLERLDGGFTHIGKTVDSARMHLDQFNKDMADFLDKSRNKRLAGVDDQIAALRTALEREDEIVEKYNSKIQNGATNGAAERHVQESLARQASIHDKINKLLLERREIQESMTGAEYLRRRQAEQEDEKIELNRPWQESQDKALMQLDETDSDLHLDEYEKKRDAIRKKYEELAKTLKYNRAALARIEKLQAEELAKIEMEEAEKRADTEMAAEKKVADARREFWEADKSLRKVIADERIAQARKAADAEIRQMERVRRRIDKRMSRFGFTLAVNPDEKPAETRRRRKRNALDASIADKQRRQAEGERVHYTRQERARIGQYRDLQKQGKQVDARLKELETAKKQQEAAAQAKASAERIAEAAKKQKEAAEKLQEAAESLKAITGENSERNQPNRPAQQRKQAKPDRLPVARSQQRHPPMVRRPMMPVASSAVHFTPNYTPQFTAILTAVNKLKSNTYIVK